MIPNPVPKMTLEEYLEFDKNSEGNFEYFDGEIFEMSGVSIEHSTIELNLAEILAPKVRAKGYRSFSASLPVKLPKLMTYRYPDFSIASDEPKFETVGGLDCLTNPRSIVEIFSESTELFDKVDKFREYRSIDGFWEYLLISSIAVRVTLLQKHHGRFWLHSDYSAGETLHLNTLDIDLNVDDLYTAVDFSLPIND